MANTEPAAPAALHPLTIANDPAFRAGGAQASALFAELASEHGADAVGIAWIQACLAVDQGAA